MPGEFLLDTNRALSAERFLSAVDSLHTAVVGLAGGAQGKVSGRLRSEISGTRATANIR